MSLTVRAWWTSNVETPDDAAGAVVGRVVAATAVGVTLAGFVAGELAASASGARCPGLADARGALAGLEAQPAELAANAAANDSADMRPDRAPSCRRISTPPTGHPLISELTAGIARAAGGKVKGRRTHLSYAMAMGCQEKTRGAPDAVPR